MIKEGLGEQGYIFGGADEDELLLGLVLLALDVSVEACGELTGRDTFEATSIDDSH